MPSLPARIDALFARLLDPRCPRCGVATRLAGFCEGCRRDLAAWPAPPPGAADPGPVLAAIAWGPASAPLLRRYKFHGDLACGLALADLALPALRGAARPELVVPVPLHQRRLRDRGYDQAGLLAATWARALGIPLGRDALRRTRDSRPQTRLSSRERRRNLVGAFEACSAMPPSVALVDDVLTTGSTVRAAADALREAGAHEVQVWVVARAP